MRTWLTATLGQACNLGINLPAITPVCHQGFVGTHRQEWFHMDPHSQAQEEI